MYPGLDAGRGMVQHAVTQAPAIVIVSGDSKYACRIQNIVQFLVLPVLWNGSDCFFPLTALSSACMRLSIHRNVSVLCADNFFRQ